jgi:hypothetical protein
MPTYKIIPSDGSRLAGVTAMSAAAVLHLVQRLDCKQADVLRNARYSFSARLLSIGVWCIYQRDEEEPDVLPLAG